MNLASNQVPNLTIDWFEMQKEYDLFVMRYEPSYVSGENREKRRSLIYGVHKDVVLFVFINLNKNGTIPATGHKKLCDDACFQFCNNSQTSCQLYNQVLLKCETHIDLQLEI